MFGIVLPITGAAETAIQAIWVEFARRLIGIQPSLPHVSLHIAPEYDAASLRPVAAQFARTWPPFTLTTSGLGLFTVPEPVLYVAVTCGRDLLDCHAHLHPLAEPPLRPVCPTTSQAVGFPTSPWRMAHACNRACPMSSAYSAPAITTGQSRNEIAYINNPLITHETWSFQGQQSVASSQ